MPQPLQWYAMDVIPHILNNFLIYLAGEAISAYALGMVRFGSVRFFKDFGEPRTGLLGRSTDYGVQL